MLDPDRDFHGADAQAFAFEVGQFVAPESAADRECQEKVGEVELKRASIGAKLTC